MMAPGPGRAGNRAVGKADTMRGLVMTHGGIGRELVNVIAMIMGEVSGLTAMSNHGKSAQDITTEIKGWLAEEPGEHAVIFIDDYGGSCANAAQLACGPEPQAAILSGVNLAMLLGFVTWREGTEFPVLVRKLVDKGREAITTVGVR